MNIIARSQDDFYQNSVWIELDTRVEKAKDILRKRAVEEKKQNQLSVFRLANKGISWDVRGKYSIQCKTIEDAYGKGGPWWMEIFIEPAAHRQHMFAKFDIGLIQGIMRFGAAKHKSLVKKRKYDDYSEEYHNARLWERRSPTPEFAKINSDDLPSTENAEWMYIWRGEGKGDGEREVINPYAMTFKEPRGMIIEGFFGCEYFDENLTFRGVKIAAGREYERDFGYDWNELKDN
ncbi:hypothetical protein M7I_5970 [Glarea lozoyensis 74030]|nr:hypothetical protein M7I_5970 [Glarea lozoyensis 74030]